MWLAAAGASTSPAATALGARAIDAAGLGAFLRDANARCHIAARGADTAQALTFALVHARQIETLILIAPPPLACLDSASLGELKRFEPPVLILFGTSASQTAPELATAWRRTFNKAHLMFIYDTDAAPDEERPQAVADIMADFMRRREGFLVRDRDDKLHA